MHAVPSGASDAEVAAALAEAQTDVQETVAAPQEAVLRSADHAHYDATRLGVAVAQLETEATTPSEVVVFSATLDTTPSGGQQAAGVAPVDVDSEEALDDGELADLTLEFGAADDVATEIPWKHDQKSAAVLSADVWKVRRQR